jgi:potassium-transporting ATPase KdpC subunit
MIQHLRANLWLLLLTVLICCVLYPLVLLGIGQTIFRDKANGSLVFDKDGTPIGSKMIAQPFTADEYFHSRPSAVSYNGAASGASNWGANNPALRKRVEGMLGQILKYHDGRPVGPDIATWVQSELQRDPAILKKWAADDAGLAEHWVAADSANGEFLTKWQTEHAEAVSRWSEANSGAEIAPKDLAALFFQSYANGETKTWPETNGQDLQIAFFNLWWKAHPNADVQPVPADMVMASGSGLDPNITLDNAMYQLDRVAAAWATKTKQDPSEVRQQIEKLLDEKSEAPLNGMVGVKLVNVLEVNLALRDRFTGS